MDSARWDWTTKCLPWSVLPSGLRCARKRSAANTWLFPDHPSPQILTRTLILPHIIWPRASAMANQSVEDLMQIGNGGWYIVISELNDLWKDLLHLVCACRRNIWSEWLEQCLPQHKGFHGSKSIFRFLLHIRPYHEFYDFVFLIVFFRWYREPAET